MRRLWSVLLLGWLALGLGHPVRAEGASPLSALAAPSLDEIRRGVEALVGPATLARCP